MIYNTQIAKHYKSYRPVLHKIILESCLPSNNKFNLALDIGCGVGHSSEALLPYCQRIIGIDNSEEMLQLAQTHDNVTFEKSNLPKLSNASESIDLITFAGSLFYCKSQELLDECVRVLRSHGEIIIYDFNIKLDKLIQALITIPLKSDYDHSLSFEGLETEQLTKVKSEIFSTQLNVELSNLIHLLLADQDFFTSFKREISADNVQETLLDRLHKLYPKGTVDVSADLYYTMYTVD